jgi:tRNA (Thr-GGU) A37 N-methylase
VRSIKVPFGCPIEAIDGTPVIEIKPVIEESNDY